MNLEEVEFPFSNLSMYFPNEDDNKLKSDEKLTLDGKINSMYFPNEDDNKLKSDEKLTLDGKINCRKFTLNEQF